MSFQLPPFFRAREDREGGSIARRRVPIFGTADVDIVSDSGGDLVLFMPLPLLSARELEFIDQVSISVSARAGAATANPLITTLSVALGHFNGIFAKVPIVQLPTIPPTTLQLRAATHPQQIVTTPFWILKEELDFIGNARVPGQTFTNPDPNWGILCEIGITNPDSVDHTFDINASALFRPVAGIESA